jgi:ATP-dependent Clp protease ATP-binding subunit ClpB
MNMNKLTEKAQEAVQAAQRLAEERNNTQLEPEHVLAALVAQEGGVVPAVLDKLGVPAKTLAQQLTAALDGLARASGPTQLYLSAATNRVFNAAEQEAERLKD